MTPTWLDKLEKKMGWFALPNLGMYLIILQVFGMLSYYTNPESLQKFILYPHLVLQGEVWRMLTFLAVPLSYPDGALNTLFTAFFLMILYYIFNSLEAHWGAFKTTFYFFFSVFLTILYSLIADYPVVNFRNIEYSLMLALCTLFGEQEIHYFVVRVKLKWLGYILGAMIIYNFIIYEPMGKLYLIIVYSNFMLFFGPRFINNLKQRQRRWDYKNKTKK
ncbi:MAG: hypothetical protein ABUK01_12795 [Leptospirales bacterium]